MNANTNLPKDIKAASQLTIEGINGIVDIVETMHYTISRFGGILGNNEQKRTTGITGFVFKIIRNIVGLVGFGLDALLGKLSLIINDKESSQGREAVLSALNGVLGDYLETKKNPLAIKIQLRVNGKPIKLEKQFSTEALRRSKGKVLLMVHGSSMNDLQWDRQGHNHATALAKDFGYLPIYLYYNSGRHISESGKDLSILLENFIKDLPQPIELDIIAHSMGGLVARSAIHYGQQANYSWAASLQKIVFLGTPHHGAPLEKGGNWINNILEISPYSKPFTRLGKIRSAGVTDLRYGNLLDEDWKGRDRFKPYGDMRTMIPLPKGVQCYTIAATMSKDSNIMVDNIVGDGLVPVKSGLGKHKNPEKQLNFPKAHQWVGHNMKHLDLLNHPDVYKIISRWLNE